MRIICQFAITMVLILYSLSTFSANQTIALPGSYDSKDSRYAIHYPVDWIYDASEPGAVIFSGKQNSPSYYSTVNIQTILTKKSGGDYANVEQFMADIKKQTLRESPRASFLEVGPIVLKEANGSTVNGQHLTFIYTYKGQLFEQWQIVVLRADGKVFYAFAYTAPIDQYKTDLPIAEAMLKTWSIY